MALRQVEVYLPQGSPPLAELDEEYNLIDRRDLTLDNGERLSRLLVQTKNTDALLERLRDEVGEVEGHRIVIIGVAATLPHQDENKGREVEERSGASEVSRISREEVLQEVNDSIGITRIHHTMVALSTIVAAGGMMRDSPAVVIGAMVIAPLIGPNIALALGTTLADWNLIRRALRINFVGLGIAFLLSVAVGFFLPVDATANEITARTEINMGDMALALAAGIAGVLSVTRGVSTALIGVMVAVALLPPLVVTGMLVGMGLWAGAYGAAMLTVTNLVAINLVGVITFRVQGVRPMMWYEEKKAKRARFVAIAIWLFLLAILVTLIVIAPPLPVEM